MYFGFNYFQNMEILISHSQAIGEIFILLL